MLPRWCIGEEGVGDKVKWERLDSKVGLKELGIYDSRGQRIVKVEQGIRTSLATTFSSDAEDEFSWEVLPLLADQRSGGEPVGVADMVSNLLQVSS
jgi:hypothetical protein